MTTVTFEITEDDLKNERDLAHLAILANAPKVVDSTCLDLKWWDCTDSPNGACGIKDGKCVPRKSLQHLSNYERCRALYSAFYTENACTKKKSSKKAPFQHIFIEQGVKRVDADKPSPEVTIDLRTKKSRKSRKKKSRARRRKSSRKRRNGSSNSGKLV